MWTLSLCRSSRVVGSRPARGYLPSRAEFVSEFVEHLAELDFEVLQLLDQPRLVLAHLMTRVHLQRRAVPRHDDVASRGPSARCT